MVSNNLPCINYSILYQYLHSFIPRFDHHVEWLRKPSPEILVSENSIKNYTITHEITPIVILGSAGTPSGGGSRLKQARTFDTMEYKELRAKYRPGQILIDGSNGFE
jgi:hypothetical protein